MNLIRKITNSHTEQDEEFVVSMKKILSYRPRTLEFYKEAFTHSSMKELNKNGFSMNYERLEFLGDAVLGSVIANYLFKKIPKGDEGYLTQMRSKIVSREHLNELGKDLDLIKFVRSAIPKSNFGENIHGNLFEALIGAIHSDRGYAFTEKLELDQGYLKSSKMVKLGLPKIKSMPEIIVKAVEVEDPKGPFGAKGVGEIGLVPTAPAAINALYQYDRKRRYELPVGQRIR